MTSIYRAPVRSLFVLAALAHSACGDSLELVPYDPNAAAEAAGDAGGNEGGGSTRDAGTTGNDGGATDGATPDASTSVAPLYVDRLTPARGVVAGGTVVRIEGDDFTDDMVVSFDGVRAASVERIDDTTLHVVTPAHAPGLVNVSIVDGARSTVLRNAYEFAERVSPGEGPAAGGTWVTLLADEPTFTPESEVFFGDVDAGTVVFLGPQVIRVLSPAAAAAGVVDVSIDSGGDPLLIGSGFLYTGAPTDGDGGSTSQAGAPRVVSAVSQDATHVRVTFSRPLDPTYAEDPTNYGIVPLYVNPEAGGLVVLEATLSADGLAVTLTTRVQSQVTYQLTVTSLRDTSGVGLAPPELLLDPTKAVFAGTGERGPNPTDSDGDGVSDADEQLGWIVRVIDLDGEVLERQVSSDPDNPDTDGDGMLDGDERGAGMDPTRPDTDQDTLGDFDEWNRYLSNPNAQDTDGDGLNDPTELFFRTSIVLADTDGDQFDDYEEVVERQRNPRIADLPVPLLRTGQVGLSLDLRYAYTNTRGEAQAVEESFSTNITAESSTDTTTYGQITENIDVGVSAELGWDDGPKAVFKPEFKYSKEWTSGEDVTKTESTIRSFDEALTRASTFETTETVERTTEGASVSVSVYFEAGSDVAFTLRNVELSLLHRDRQDPTRLVPVASLQPANANFEVNLGPGVPAQGPVIFNNSDVFPSRVESLLRNPEAIVVRFANYDVVSEDGRNLAFISQEVEERTGTIAIDYGNGNVDDYRIALSNEWDPATGQPLGLRLAEALRVIGLSPGPCLGVAGAGGECSADADCAGNAAGDPDNDPTRCDTSSGFGVCVPESYCNDVEVVATVVDPYTQRSAADPAVTGTFGTRIEVDELGDPVFDAEGQPRMGLFRVRGVQADLDSQAVAPAGLVGRGDWDGQINPRFRHQWVLLSDGEVDTSFGNVAFRPGGDYLLAYTVDEDGDGLFEVQEKVYGTSDVNVDTDGDGLSDWEEVRGGVGPTVTSPDGSRTLPTTTWEVETNRIPAYRVYSSPQSADTDGDGLSDLAEVLRSPAPTDPTKTDTDEDGIPDADEVTGWTYVLRSGSDSATFFTDPLDDDSDGDDLLDGAEELWQTNPTVADRDSVVDSDNDGLPDADDVNCEALAAGRPGDPPDLDADGDNDGLGDLIEVALGTDPCDSDSDGDGVVDLLDWDGELDAAVEDTCVRALNCLLPDRGAGQLGTSPTEADTDGDGLNDGDEIRGWLVTLEGAAQSGGLLSYPVNSDPLDPDTDGDWVPDGREEEEGCDPRRLDTDGDGDDDATEIAEAAELGRNPLKADRALQVTWSWLRFNEHPEADPEYQIDIHLQRPGSTAYTAFSTEQWSNQVGNPDPPFYECTDGGGGGGGTTRFGGLRPESSAELGDTIALPPNFWNVTRFPLGNDEYAFLYGSVREVDDCLSGWQIRWLFGGPSTQAGAQITADAATGSYLVLSSGAVSDDSSTTTMDVELAFYIEGVSTPREDIRTYWQGEWAADPGLTWEY